MAKAVETILACSRRMVVPNGVLFGDGICARIKEELLKESAPIQFEEFAPCVAWWKKREENERAWKMPAKDLLKYDTHGNLMSVNLDIKNPTAKEDITHLPPEQLAESILQKEQRIGEIIVNIRDLLIKHDA